MANTICNVVASYLQDLTATHPLCVTLGTRLVPGTNLYIAGDIATTVNSLNIVPYGGIAPNNDGNRQNPYIQIESRTTSKGKALGVQQDLINLLHMNELNSGGLVQAVQSAPILLEAQRGGEYFKAVSNYSVKHIKIT